MPIFPQPDLSGPLEDGIGLCLSGGGYRAMLYHLGSIWRMNELGLLHPTKLKRVSSVSGGSITSAVLGMNWHSLNFDAQTRIADASSFIKAVVDPVRQLANESIDVAAVGWGTFNPFKSISDVVEGYYRDYVFGTKTLQDLPDAPRFVINATNVQSGSLFRFSKPYMVDYQVGRWNSPIIPLARAVAASSAFPPFLSPCTLNLSSIRPDEVYSLGKADPDHYLTKICLTDGGVYDNLGLETVWKSFKIVLVSDGGRKSALDPSPASDWALHSRRLIDLLERQVSALRKKDLIESFQAVGQTAFRQGAYWGITTPYQDYEPANLNPAGIDLKLHAHETVPEVANMETRLTAIQPELQEALINWGYASADAALRRYFVTTPSSSPQLPYPV